MNVKQAPLMLVRCNADSLLQSFQSSEQIPATLYALHEYMQHRSVLGRKFTPTELASIKFRHRAADKQLCDVHPPIAGLQEQWPAPWKIVFVKDEDRVAQDLTLKQGKKKPFTPHTVFGYCSQFPVA